MGSIFRTADAAGPVRNSPLQRPSWRASAGVISNGAGIEKLYLCGITPTPIDRFGKLRPQLGKVSLGAEKSVAWEYCKSIAALIKKLKNPSVGGGYKILAVEQSKKSIPYYKVALRQVQGKNKLALIFGNEVRGLPPSVLKLADKILEIPMRGKKESLNVGVAFGIVAFRLLYP